MPVHMLGVVLMQSAPQAVYFILPVLARKRFDANNWQTLLVTAAPTVFFSFSIFWNDFFKRRRFGTYLFVYWLVACLPLALIAFAQDYWMLLVPHLVACVGGAGYHPAAGELLHALYPASKRGRLYGAIWGASMIAGAAGGYAVGAWLDANPEAFRVYMPAAAVLQLAGVAVFTWLARATGTSAARVIVTDRAGAARLFEPVFHMKDVLKSDPVFARYEAAYMTYGVGWMIAYALLPILVTSKLHLGYEEVAKSTHVAYVLALVAALVPAGMLMDRVGAVRSTGVSFGLLTLYPIGLILSGNAHDLTIASLVYGMAHAGASVGWMLGPVALAPSPDKVPQYVAIHATLVGVRGKLFQGLGVLLYSLTGSFTIPLVIAAGAYAWSAVQMWQLHGRMSRPGAEKAA